MRDIFSIEYEIKIYNDKTKCKVENKFVKRSDNIWL